MMNDLRKIGLSLKMRRLELELSQDQLSEMSGIERSYISGIENGRKNLSLQAFLCLVKALEIESWCLLEKAMK